MDNFAASSIKSSWANVNLWEIIYHKALDNPNTTNEDGLQFIVNEIRRLLRDVSTFFHCVFKDAPDEESLSCVEDLLDVWMSLKDSHLQPDESLNKLDAVYPELKKFLRVPNTESSRDKAVVAITHHDTSKRSPSDTDDADNIEEIANEEAKVLSPDTNLEGFKPSPQNVPLEQICHRRKKSDASSNHTMQIQDQNEETKNFDCEQCDEQFFNKKTKSLHIRTKHVKKYECQLCGLRVGSPYQLERHHWTHNGEKPYECDQCEYRSARKGNLDKHKGEKHGDFGDRSCFCEICGVPFQTPGSLKYHIQMKHVRRENRPVKDEKPFQCDRCEYKFSSQFHLNQHVYAKHEFDGVKRFCCELCGKSYKSGNTLKGHLRFVHWGEQRRKSSQRSSNKVKNDESYYILLEFLRGCGVHFWRMMDPSIKPEPCDINECGPNDPVPTVPSLSRILDNLSRDQLLSLLQPRFFDKVSFWDMLYWKATKCKPDGAYGFQVLLQDLECLLQEMEHFIQNVFQLDAGKHPSGKNRSMNGVIKSWELLGIYCEPKSGEELKRLAQRYPGMEHIFPGDFDKQKQAKRLEDVEMKEEDGFDAIDLESNNRNDPLEGDDERIVKAGNESGVDLNKLSEDEDHFDSELLSDGPACDEMSELEDLTCSACFKVFSDQNIFEKHVPDCSQLPECEKCGKQFPRCKSKKRYHAHIKRCAGSTDSGTRWKSLSANEFICSVEGCLNENVFQTLNAVKEHVTEHHATCATCETQFSHKPQEWISDHIKSCKGRRQKKKPKYKKVGTKQFICSFEGCSYNQVFKTTKAARFHFFNEHTTEEDKIYPCSFCETKFAFITARTRHINLKHIKKYKCDLCGRAFGEPNQLAKHQKTHSGEKPFSCEQCGNRFSRKSNLDQHKQTVHGDFGKRDCYCEVCGMPFASVSSLKVHILMKHTRQENAPPKEDKPYHCDKCDYRASCPAHLRSHVESRHDFDGIKKFFCEICGNAFKGMNTLRGHLRFVHGGAKRKKYAKNDDNVNQS
ncbi:uncharacterized protein LOC131890738 [Tigriopus californicus]|uniref:uncharacterized protein LOC131890738 n=1 Tax=Tigriopus californicus TaxID=6832 RepID=UPI0027DA4AF9|nr:uncharacterized protein LOC131890738 [Tigriopus californicus]